MAWTCKSALLPPIRLSTVVAQVFSLYMDLPSDVEAEIDYRFGVVEPTGPGDFLYRECFIPVEGHFPLLSEELLRSAAQSDSGNLARLLQDELVSLRKSGTLGNVVILRRSIYELIERKLQRGEFLFPMELVFGPDPASRLEK